MNILPEIPFLITFMFIIFPLTALAAITIYYYYAMKAERAREREVSGE
ncbi:hypothetical protein [Cloacibacillus porcorum]|nr:hypothetical protein [Cloacibacillus porcorum]MDD7650506.1 hypothetical protein [Cloacibacillus porcorum]MDY4093383.1 hypothetical protein [Cloacibacillus porcorum]